MRLLFLCLLSTLLTSCYYGMSELPEATVISGKVSLEGSLNDSAQVEVIGETKDIKLKLEEIELTIVVPYTVSFSSGHDDYSSEFRRTVKVDANKEYKVEIKQVDYFSWSLQDKVVAGVDIRESEVTFQGAKSSDELKTSQTISETDLNDVTINVSISKEQLANFLARKVTQVRKESDENAYALIEVELARIDLDKADSEEKLSTFVGFNGQIYDGFDDENCMDDDNHKNQFRCVEVEYKVKAADLAKAEFLLKLAQEGRFSTNLRKVLYDISASGRRAAVVYKLAKRAYKAYAKHEDNGWKTGKDEVIKSDFGALARDFYEDFVMKKYNRAFGISSGLFFTGTMKESGPAASISQGSIDDIINGELARVLANIR